MDLIRLPGGREYHHLFLAALLLVLLPSCARTSRDAPSSSRQSKVNPRYAYRPIRADQFGLVLQVKSSYRLEGTSQDLSTTITSGVRLISFKNDPDSSMHLMILLDDPVVISGTVSGSDTSRMAGWAMRRLEIVITPLGRLRQRLEIEKFPPVQIPGFARPEENGLHILLSSLLPELPDVISFDAPAETLIQDSLSSTLPDKLVQRKWKERRKCTLFERTDSLIRMGIESRMHETERIDPLHAERAVISADNLLKGECTLLHDGTLQAYTYSRTIYRTLSLPSTGGSGGEETTEIHFVLHRRPKVQ